MPVVPTDADELGRWPPRPILSTVTQFPRVSVPESQGLVVQALIRARRRSYQSSGSGSSEALNLLVNKIKHCGAACAENTDRILEGVSVATGHPPLALVTFISAIEAIGSKLKKPARCEHCRQITEATSRFRQAVDLIADPGEAAVAFDLYKLRSSTAHAAPLRGSEPFLGSHSSGGPFGPDEDLL